MDLKPEVLIALVLIGMVALHQIAKAWRKQRGVQWVRSYISIDRICERAAVEPGALRLIVESNGTIHENGRLRSDYEFSFVLTWRGHRYVTKKWNSVYPAKQIENEAVESFVLSKQNAV